MELSVQLDSNILHKVQLELENLYAVIDGYCALEAIQQSVPEDKRASVFWQEVCNALTDLFVINWCKLFGIDSSDQCWKQATIEQKAFREAIYAGTGFNYQSWNAYRHSLHELKGEMTLHLTPYHKMSSTPELKPAFQIAKECHLWLHGLLQHFSIQLEGPVNQWDYVEQSYNDALESVQAIPH